MINQYIQNLYNIFTQLPSLSENNARKIALSLVSQSKIKGILHTLNQIDQKLKICLCGNIDELLDNQCSLCIKKQTTKILIVLTINDLFTLENSGIYEGQYHVLCQDNISLTNLRINELLQRLQQSNTQEIIFALSYHYLSSTIEKYTIKQIKKLNENIKITKIQNGMPVGSSINNETESTLKAALLSRQEITN